MSERPDRPEEIIADLNVKCDILEGKRAEAEVERDYFMRQVELLSHALRDICSRCEERDTGQGYYREAGLLALALHRVARLALAEEAPAAGEGEER